MPYCSIAYSGPDSLGLTRDIAAFVQSRGGNIIRSNAAASCGRAVLLVTVEASQADLDKCKTDSGVLSDQTKGEVVITIGGSPVAPPNYRKLVHYFAMGTHDVTGLLGAVTTLIRNFNINIVGHVGEALKPPFSNGSPTYHQRYYLHVPENISLAECNAALQELAEKYRGYLYEGIQPIRGIV